MNTIWFAAVIFAVIVVLPIAFRILKAVVGVLLLKAAAGKVLTSAGAASVASQPDTLDLAPLHNAEWKDPERTASATSDLENVGFRAAGDYTITQMPGIVLRLFTHPVDGYYAAFFEHPKGIASTEIVCVCDDGSGISISALPDSGQRHAPNKQRIYMPGASVAEQYARMKSITPPAAIARADGYNVVQMYRDEYARAIAWRKANPMTAHEVAASQRMLRDIKDRAA